MSENLVIDIADVESAADILSGVAIRTPLLEYVELNERVGGRVLVKFEGVQHAGSFKFRGAYNRLSRLSTVERAAGVVAWSSGNHAQGVAAAAARLGINSVIVMPADAPGVKIDNTRRLGAEIHFYDRFSESREKIATMLAQDRGAVLVPSYDDPFVIAGQGTIGLELLEQAADAGASINLALVCCGGGGLIAGIATALKARASAIEIYSVEPSAFDDTARSLCTGQREANDSSARSICDALLAPQPGHLTFPINRALLAGGLSVSDDEVCEAMRFAFHAMKLVIEPGGAVALAAALTGKLSLAGRTTAIIVSGANVDPVQYARIITDS